jgi:GAF domain
VPRRVVLLTRDASLAVAVKALLSDDDRVTELDSPQELPPMGDLPVDVVVIDLPGSSRAATLERVRGRFSGPLVVLLGHGEDPAKARGVYRCSVLARPFGMSQLWSLLVDSAAEAVTEVIPAVQRRDPAHRPSGQGAERPSPSSQRPAGATERPGGAVERSGGAVERPEGGAQRPEEAGRPAGAAQRPERPVPASERPQPPPQPEPERPSRVADQPDLAPERQAHPQAFQRPGAPAPERPREPARPQAPKPTPGERPQRSGPPVDRPAQGAPPPSPARPDLPARPESPSRADSPARSPARADSPARSDSPARADSPAQPESPARPDAPARTTPAAAAAAAAAAADAERSPRLLRNRQAPAGPAADAERPERSPGAPAERMSPPAAERPGRSTGAAGDPAPPGAERPERSPGPSADRTPPVPSAQLGRAERSAGPVEQRPERAAPIAPREAPTGDQRAGAEAKPSGKEARKPPPWNWRSRRFKSPPPEQVDPGALTQPMPRLRPANGAPPAPARPEPRVNGVPSPARPSDPASPVDRRDRSPAESKEAARAVDRDDGSQAPGPRDPAPAANRGEDASPASPRSGPAVEPRPPAPKVDRPAAPTAESHKPEQAAGRPEQAGRPEPSAPPPEPSARPELSAPPAEPAARAEPGAAVDPMVRPGEPLRSAAPAPVERAEEIAPDPPEAVAGRLAERLEADTVALLLDNNKGLLEVAGGIGLTAAERKLQVEYSHEVLLELFRVGVGLIEDTEHVRGLIGGIPGCNSQSLVMVPLVHEGHGFGALIIGRTSPPGQPRPEFTEPEIEALMDFADDVAAPLRSTVLLRRLKGQLNTPNRT